VLKGFVVVVIVFVVIGSLIFFCWDNHVGFGVIACWYMIKIFFVLFVTVWGCLVLVAFFCLWVNRVASCSVCFL
jgi:hypothetical protein